MDNSFSRIAIRSLELDNPFSRIAIRSLELNNPIRGNELSISRERITNPWERIAQFDITIYLWLFLKIPMSLQGFRTMETIWNEDNLDFTSDIKPKIFFNIWISLFSAQNPSVLNKMLDR